MPQLTTVDASGRTGCGNGEGGIKEGKKNGVIDGEKERETTGGKKSWSWKNLRWKHWPIWLRCLAQVTPLWLVLQEEAPLHPSVSLLQAGGRLLLAVLLWTGLGLCVSLLLFLYRYREAHRQENSISLNSEVPVRGIKQDQQACQKAASHLVAMISALQDGLVVSLLQEPLSDSSLTQIHSLLTRLEAVSQTVNKGDFPKERLLQASDDKGKVSAEESSLKDRVEHICTYLQDRVSALHSLLQVQDLYGACVADVQQGLQEHWEMLEYMHTRVTLQPEKCQGPEDPDIVLSDTESMYTQLGLFKRRVDECHKHLSTSKQLLQELENRQQVLAGTVGLKLEPTWTKDFLLCNTQQFEKVNEDFKSLEQQTVTFVTHLRGLRLLKESNVSSLNAEQVQSTPSSLVSAVPVYSTSLNTASPTTDPDPEASPRPSSKLSAMNCLCGGRLRK